MNGQEYMLLYRPEPKHKKSPGKEEKHFHNKDKSDSSFKNTVEEYEEYEEEGDGKGGRYRQKRRHQRVVYRPKNPGA